MQIEISNYTKKIKKNILLDNINIKMETLLFLQKLDSDMKLWT